MEIVLFSTIIVTRDCWNIAFHDWQTSAIFKELMESLYVKKLIDIDDYTLAIL